MVVFFLSVALTNLALGYALALYLHPHDDGGDLSPAHLQPNQPTLRVSDAAASEPPVATPENNSNGEAALDASAEEVTADAAPVVPPAEPPTIVQPEATAATVAPAQTPISEPAEAASADDAATLEGSDILRCIGLFKSQLQEYRTRLAKIDERVHACVEQPDAEQVQGCLRDLRTMNYDYFEHQLAISDQVSQSTHAAEAESRNRISIAVAAQSAQISDVDCALVELDPTADARGCAQQLLGETARLRASDAFSDALDSVERELTGPAGSITGQANLPANQGSPQTLRAAITARLAQSPGALKPTSVALVDVDRVAALNEQYGSTVVDRVLQKIVLDADRAVADGGLMTSENPQRLLLLLPSATPTVAVDTIEHFRQSVAATQYTHADAQFSISLSCGIAHAIAGDTLESLIERATTTLQEAKRYGRNRTFTLEDKYPTPVAPPTLTIESRVVTL